MSWDKKCPEAILTPIHPLSTCTWLFCFKTWLFYLAQHMETFFLSGFLLMLWVENDLEHCSWEEWLSCVLSWAGAFQLHKGYLWQKPRYRTAPLAQTLKALKVLFQVLAGVLIRLKEKKCLHKLPASLALIWMELSVQAQQILIIKKKAQQKSKEWLYQTSCSDLYPSSDHYELEE